MLVNSFGLACFLKPVYFYVQIYLEMDSWCDVLLRGNCLNLFYFAHKLTSFAIVFALAGDFISESLDPAKTVDQRHDFEFSLLFHF